MAQPQQSAVRNRLLAALTPEDFSRLASRLEPVPLPLHEVLIAPQQAIAQAYFVEEGIVSLVADTREGRIEVGLTGREGFVGVPIALGAQTTPHTAIVQASGEALRIAAGALEDALDASAGLRRVLGRYVQSLLVQVGQTVYANADLTVEARLARWILMTHDRLEQDELPLTHEVLSKMLGVRRPTVTTATHLLEGAGMIRARRGRITVVDREKLEDLAGAIYGPAGAV
ncbi:Crp/Fnr family transcriptional regulator [Methylobacterium sp. PvR107]|uniref:Crp/Fnr family transcriptional regulator n=1 Tax=Methylobacterium sp. PvR107 TaxID=2806597 RepID=UPI001AE9E313|nr:Crp/Fnr family transcriptional regulator [Methylobacterium sp. PvR107]MBP1184041.1 CRP-like cAMP-binding protein [Methylobacterium sp. PvR107]